MVFSDCCSSIHFISTGHSKHLGQPVGQAEMRRKRIILILVAMAIAALLAVYYFYLGSTVPNGQQPLVRLNSANVGSLKNAFNEPADSVRVIVMLSPT